jgi:hypothetical protein
MTSSHLAKTPRLEIAIQLTEVPDDGSSDARVWEVHDVERNRGFRVKLARATIEAAHAEGATAAGRSWSATELEHAIGLAIERLLTSGGEKQAGILYDVEVTPEDLRASQHRSS